MLLSRLFALVLLLLCLLLLFTLSPNFPSVFALNFFLLFFMICIFVLIVTHPLISTLLIVWSNAASFGLSFRSFLSLYLAILLIFPSVLLVNSSLSSLSTLSFNFSLAYAFVLLLLFCCLFSFFIFLL